MTLYDLYRINIGKHRRSIGGIPYVRLCSLVAVSRRAVESMDDSLDGRKKVHLLGRYYRSIGSQGPRIVHPQLEEPSIWGERVRR